MSIDEKALRQRLKTDFPYFAEKCLVIRGASGKLERFTLNKAQKYGHELIERQKREKGFVRAIILKGRQQGWSTYVDGRGYWLTTSNFGIKSFILTHEDSATQNLFEMVKRYHEHCPALVKPSIKNSNAIELSFDKLDSGYKLGTAGNANTGRSATIQFLHASEAAMYKNAADVSSGVMQAVHYLPGTEIFIESTAKGVGNWFHQQWQLAEAGLSDFIPIFSPWFWTDHYRKPIDEKFVRTDEEKELAHLYMLDDEQLNWRRMKLVEFSMNGADGSKLFKQEFPCNPVEAFQSSGDNAFISPDLVMQARKQPKTEAYGPLLLGVDPARFGDDRTSIIRRQGRVAFGLESYKKKDTMQTVGIVHNIIEKERPVKVFVDVVGLGAGVYDRLKELHPEGDIIVAVNSASSPRDDKHFSNKRAELWSLGKQWLEDAPCSIPDVDSLHADLCGPTYDHDSNGRLKIEKKEDMKKRGIRSSDEADALLLTFALPASALIDKTNKTSNTAKSIMANTAKINALKKTRYQGL
jgi:hypothetical protein